MKASSKCKVNSADCAKTIMSDGFLATSLRLSPSSIVLSTSSIIIKGLGKKTLDRSCFVSIINIYSTAPRFLCQRNSSNHFSLPSTRSTALSRLKDRTGRALAYRDLNALACEHLAEWRL